MTFLGIFLLAGSYALLKFLATPRRGFVYSDIEEEESVQVESLILAETFSPVPAQPEPTRFGGGSFGGAGSSADSRIRIEREQSKRRRRDVDRVTELKRERICRQRVDQRLHVKPTRIELTFETRGVDCQDASRVHTVVR